MESKPSTNNPTKLIESNQRDEQFEMKVTIIYQNKCNKTYHFHNLQETYGSDVDCRKMNSSSFSNNRFQKSKKVSYVNKKVRVAQTIKYSMDTYVE